MSTRRGYLETQGDRKRLRIVKEGYDADDEATPFDAVLFDSESDGMGSFLETGSATIPQGSNNFIATTSGMWIRTWSYPFVPLCIFQFNRFGAAEGLVYSSYVNTSAGPTGSTMGQPQIRVSTSGIWVRGAFNKATGHTFTIHWIALRVPAT